jgi:hypothetical protein
MEHGVQEILQKKWFKSIWNITETIQTEMRISFLNNIHCTLSALFLVVFRPNLYNFQSITRLIVGLFLVIFLRLTFPFRSKIHFYRTEQFLET